MAEKAEKERIAREKAKQAERIAREKAKQARIETSNILLDLEELRRINIKSRTVKEILARSFLQRKQKLQVQMTRKQMKNQRLNQRQG